MKETLHSALSKRILLTLDDKPAESIAALARELELLRPSVSRAINSLQNMSLIKRQGRIVLLTQEGLEEVQRIKTDNAGTKEQAKASTGIYAKVSKQQEQLGQSTISPTIRTTLDIINSPSMRMAHDIINSPSMRMTRDIINSPSMQLQRKWLSSTNISEQLAGTIASISQIQQINLSFLQVRASPFYAFEHLFVENNLFISRMIADLDVIASIRIKPSSTLETLRHLTIEATEAYNINFRQANDALVNMANQEDSIGNHLEMELLVPTTTASSLVSTTRDVIAYESDPQQENLVSGSLIHIHSQQYTAISSMLEEYLNPLGQRFINKWHGAWQTLSSESEDRYSQATHSGRELLMQLLAYLAPDDLFTKDEIAGNNGKPPTRRMRIKRIIGSDSKAEWIEKTASAIDSTYDVLAADSHNRDEEHRHPDTAAGELIVLGGLLLTLLSKRKV